MSITSTGLSDSEFGPLVVKPKVACRMLACGITRLYALIGARELDAFRDGRSRKITTASIHRYIEKQLGAEPERSHGATDRATAASLAVRERRNARRAHKSTGQRQGRCST
jgi:excisionase family DNA binding protein